MDWPKNLMSRRAFYTVTMDERARVADYIFKVHGHEIDEIFIVYAIMADLTTDFRSESIKN